MKVSGDFIGRGRSGKKNEDNKNGNEEAVVAHETGKDKEKIGRKKI